MTALVSYLHNSLSKALKVSTAALIAQNQRTVVIAENIANAGGINDKPGADPYRRRITNFKSVFDREQNMNLVKFDRPLQDMTPFAIEYDPGNPMADAEGYIKRANVNSAIETADLLDATRAHGFNTRAFEHILKMMNEMSNLLRV